LFGIPLVAANKSNHFDGCGGNGPDLKTDVSRFGA
jgi:hypothetical protein